MTHQTRRSRRVFPSPLARTSRRRLQLETLEDRSLLSGSGLVDLSSFRLDPSGEYDSRSLLVQFQPELTDTTAAAVLPGSQLGPVMSLLPGLREVTLPAGVSVPTALAALNANPLVVYAEPNYVGHLQLTPNDPLYGNLYGMNQIQAPQAWDYWQGLTVAIQEGLPPVVVADMDTGAQYDHPDLCNNIWINQGEIPADRLANLTDDGDGIITFYDLNLNPNNRGPGKITDQNGDGRICGSDILRPRNGDLGGWVDNADTDGNGRRDDLIGWDFDTNDNNPSDGHGHGTHTAGTIGAEGNNAVGVTGVSWYTQIMVLKINVGSSGSINISAAIAAIDYAVQMNAVASNNSWGGSFTSTPFTQALDRARAAGHLYIAAAGNGNANVDTNNFRPCSYSRTHDNVICVAATTSTDGRASFSNWGLNSVQLGAPGNAIQSTYLNNGYASLSGTSMAAPHVTGAVAFLSSANIFGLDYLGIKDVILAGVDPNTALRRNGPNPVSTGGRLNLFNSLILLWTGGGFGYVDPGRSGEPVESAQAVPSTQETPSNLDNAALVITTLTDTEAAPVQPAAFEPSAEFSPTPVVVDSPTELRPDPAPPVLSSEVRLGDEQVSSARAEIFPDDPLASL